MTDGAVRAHDHDAQSTGADQPFLFDLASLDLSRVVRTRADIEKYIPHRGVMSFLDEIRWEAPDFTRCVAVKRIRDDEFWVPGHFPGKAMYPGVFMIESGAQATCYLYMIRQPAPRLVAFLRLGEVAFRHMVVPGDTLYILVQEIKMGRRQFETRIQGIVNLEKVAFETTISGMSMPMPEGGNNTPFGPRT
jgi:3-hydroxyacyl-[acyl-carrier-protein] dehydratase